VCCGIGFKKVKKSEIRQISSQDLVNKLNYSKPSIVSLHQSNARTKKSYEEIDSLLNTNVELRDLVCKKCISYANYQNTKLLKSNKRRRTERSQVSRVETIVTSPQLEYEEQTIELNIPHTASTHSRCIICTNSKKIINIPKEAYFDTFVKSRIVIPKGMSFATIMYIEFLDYIIII
jgi:hypothetical protein